MRVIKSIVFSNIWIALGASCYTLHTFQIANLEINYLLLSLIFSATLFSYNFQRVVRLNKIDGDKSERHLWLQKYTTLLKFVIATSFLMSAMLSVYVFTISQLLLMSIPFLLVVFYATFLTNKKKGLRDLPFVKIFIIALVWVVITGALPFLVSGKTDDMMLILIDKFLFIIAITIPFDIRDLVYDKARQKTLPMIFGERGSKIIAVFCLLISLSINLWLGAQIELTIPFYVLTMALITFSTKNKQELYYAGLIDGLLVISPLLFI